MPADDECFLAGEDGLLGLGSPIGLPHDSSFFSASTLMPWTSGEIPFSGAVASLLGGNGAAHSVPAKIFIPHNLVFPRTPKGSEKLFT